MDEDAGEDADGEDQEGPEEGVCGLFGLWLATEMELVVDFGVGVDVQRLTETG